MAGKFELKVSSNGKYHFNLKAGNGQIILSSEMYESKAAAENGIASVKKNAGDDARYERKESSNGKPYFNLKASNGQVIGKSEMYESAASMENGIESVKKNGPDADTVEA
ncbi:MAG: YegP family protein [Pyrinomonadaceae bacterium]|nr:YegP family protein [Pyrinomonadaceae bacterium]